VSVESPALAIAGYAPGIVAKTTVILLVAAGVSFSARRASAAWRHLLWLCALTSCTALVLVSPLSRRIVVPVPSFIPLTSASTVLRQSAEASDIGSVPNQRRATSFAARHGDTASLDTPAAEPTAVRSRFAIVALVLWLGGFLVVTLRFAWGYASIGAIVRRSCKLDSPEWCAAIARLTTRTDIELWISADVASPFTLGVFRPTIVLSADAYEWDDERRETVLRHEIAHVERGDIASQWIGFVACALLWFHPLAWLGLARLRRESESAADDRVIGAGASPIAYAVHLVAIARGVGDTPSTLPMAIGMGTPPLEKRIRAMLDGTRARHPVSSRARMVGVSVALGAMVPIGAVEFARAAPPVIPPTEKHVEAPVGPPPLEVSKPVSPAGDPTGDVERTVIEDHDPVSRSPATDSLRSDSGAPEVPARLGVHPDFSGNWGWAFKPSADSGGSAAASTLNITQTPTTIAWAIERRATDEFGRDRGLLRATMQLADGTPAQGSFSLNGTAARMSLFAMSWDADTLTIRTAQLGRHAISGAVERFWLTADGRELVAHSAPYGYIVNDEVTDTLRRRR
jgi:beta-lactamase regulating signal transducer with metallopeptidase domain